MPPRGLYTCSPNASFQIVVPKNASNTHTYTSAIATPSASVASKPPCVFVGSPVSGLIAMSAYASDVTNTVMSDTSSRNAKKRAAT